MSKREYFIEDVIGYDVGHTHGYRDQGMSAELAPELWNEVNGEHLELSELGCQVAEALGCTVDVDAYGCAFARPPKGD